MRVVLSVITALIMTVFWMPVSAVELDLVPKKFTAEQKITFNRERAELATEKKSLNGKLARHNKRCATPKPYQAHQCSTERLELFKTVDKYNNKVLDFNKRMAVLDKGVEINNPAVEKPATGNAK